MSDSAPLPPFNPPLASAEGIPIADIRLPTTLGDYRHAAYPVKRPEQEIAELMVECRASTLIRCRRETFDN
jgi:hypothetical protein